MHTMPEPVQDSVFRRKEIAEFLIGGPSSIKSGNITTLAPADLEVLFQLYDRIFLNSWFRDNFKGKLKFSLSRKMTKSAGLTLCPKNPGKLKPEELTLEIRIGVDFFLRYGARKGGHNVCGIRTQSSLEALQLVFEHELCHVLEFAVYGKSSCKGKRFKALANGLFGHTDSYHRLPTQRQLARSELGLGVGDPVSFVYDERELSGVIYNINKRATVMVKDRWGRLADKYGNRYSKYYVPLPALRKIC